jgi:PAS domain S-box-containing protein
MFAGPLDADNDRVLAFARRLTTSQDHAHALVCALRDGLVLFDAAGRIVDVNLRFLEMTGLARDELQGAQPPFAFWPEEERPAVDALFTEAGRGQVHELESVLARLDGTRCPVAVTVTALDGDEGFVGVVRDISREVAERERLREAHRVARLVSWDWDPVNDRLVLSNMDGEVTGLRLASSPTREEVLSAFAAPHDERLRAALDCVLAGRDELALELPIDSPLPDVRWVEVRMRPVRDAGGRPVGVHGTVQDVTACKEAELAHRASEERLREAQRMAQTGSFEADYCAGSVTWSPELYRLFGVEAQSFTHTLPDARAYLPEPDRDRVRRVCEETVGDGQPRVVEHRYLRGAEVRCAETRVEPLCAGGKRYGVRGTLQDITARVESERRLRAAHDELRAITNSMGEGLCTMDVEGRLTYINRAGEELLGWRQDELLGRVMHDIVHTRRPDGSPLPIDECRLLSAGRDNAVARLDDEVFVRRDGSDVPVKITTAPFETEDGVRGSVVVFSDISAQKRDELRLREQIDKVTWAGRVRDALSEERFVLHAQPIIDLATGATVQHELLIRMLDREGQLVLPGQFIPAAEEYGLILDIDRWVVGEAVALAAEGHAVELNLSACSLTTPAIIEDLERGLARTGADASLIVAEITETALLDDACAAEHFIARLKALGCRLALDDFGTGYGGFTHLKRLPVDLLKIDAEFVRDLATNQASRHVVSAVVSLARGFGKETVAEGVEDDATLEIVRELGVDYAQGYAIARPAPAELVLATTDPIEMATTG